jgi:hypothetical protein
MQKLEFHSFYSLIYYIKIGILAIFEVENY